MADIRSTAAEIRRGKKEEEEEGKKLYGMKILWSALLHRATIMKCSWLKFFTVTFSIEHSKYIFLFQGVL